MTPTAHCGTHWMLLIASCIAVACGEVHRVREADAGDAGLDTGAYPGDPLRDAERPDSSNPDAGEEVDASPVDALACSADSQCTLRPQCCSCTLALERVSPVRRGHVSLCGDVQCSPCAPQSHDPLRPWPAPACDQGRCAVRDLRVAEETRCSRDQDCELSSEQTRCCSPCSADPRLYRAKRKGSAPVLAGSCPPHPACPDCVAPHEPSAYCAADGHCAVRATPARGGVPSSTCYAPGQNIAIAYQADALGCDCFPGDRDVCEQGTALVCQDGRWQAVEDGPCGPTKS